MYKYLSIASLLEGTFGLISLGKCSDPTNPDANSVQPFQNIDLSKLEGSWYHSLTDKDFLGGFNVDCIKYDITKTGPGQLESMVTHWNKWKKMTFMQIESEINETGPAIGSDFLFNQKYDYIIADTDYDTYLVGYLCHNLDSSDIEGDDKGPSLDEDNSQDPLRMQFVDVIIRDPNATADELDEIKKKVANKLKIGYPNTELEDFKMDNLVQIKQGRGC